MDDCILVDCQHDFIDGTLACEHGHEAVRYLTNFLNTHAVRACYTADWHSPGNQSFQVNGGIWPVHCVAGTAGAELDPAFYREVKDGANRPSGQNLFKKGRSDEVEEYSAFAGTNEDGAVLGDVVSAHVYVGGIASEYCVRETVLALLAAGHRVTLLVEGLAYVSKADHERNLADLAERGVSFLGE